MLRDRMPEKLIFSLSLFSVFVFSMVWAKLLQLRPTLCNPMDYSPPGSSVHGISQARILEWVVMLSSRGSSQLGDQTHDSMSPALADSFFTTSMALDVPNFLF